MGRKKTIKGEKEEGNEADSGKGREKSMRDRRGCEEQEEDDTARDRKG